MADNTSELGYAVHEVLAAVLRVDIGAGETRPADGKPRLSVLLWQRALPPHAKRWALPGGKVNASEDVESSIRRQLGEKVDVQNLAHVEQLAVFSAPNRVPHNRVIATSFLGLIPCDVDPAIPEDTAWHPIDDLPVTAFDHRDIIESARIRLRGKLSYTNIGFSLAPPKFTISELRDIYSAALGYQVSATNLQRVLSRRGLLANTGEIAGSGPSGGRPAALFRFMGDGLLVTDPSAVLRPPHIS